MGGVPLGLWGVNNSAELVVAASVHPNSGLKEVLSYSGSEHFCQPHRHLHECHWEDDRVALLECAQWPECEGLVRGQTDSKSLFPRGGPIVTEQGSVTYKLARYSTAHYRGVELRGELPGQWDDWISAVEGCGNMDGCVGLVAQPKVLADPSKGFRYLPRSGAAFHTWLEKDSEQTKANTFLLAGRERTGSLQTLLLGGAECHPSADDEDNQDRMAVIARFECKESMSRPTLADVKHLSDCLQKFTIHLPVNASYCLPFTPVVPVPDDPTYPAENEPCLISAEGQLYDLTGFMPNWYSTSLSQGAWSYFFSFCGALVCTADGGQASICAQPAAAAITSHSLGLFDDDLEWRVLRTAKPDSKVYGFSTFLSNGSPCDVDGAIAHDYWSHVNVICVQDLLEPELVSVDIERNCVYNVTVYIPIDHCNSLGPITASPTALPIPHVLAPTPVTHLTPCATVVDGHTYDFTAMTDRLYAWSASETNTVYQFSFCRPRTCDPRRNPATLCVVLGGSTSTEMRNLGLWDGSEDVQWSRLPVEQGLGIQTTVTNGAPCGPKLYSSMIRIICTPAQDTRLLGAQQTGKCTTEFTIRVPLSVCPAGDLPTPVLRPTPVPVIPNASISVLPCFVRAGGQKYDLTGLKERTYVWHDDNDLYSYELTVVPRHIHRYIFSAGTRIRSYSHGLALYVTEGVSVHSSNPRYH